MRNNNLTTPYRKRLYPGIFIILLIFSLSACGEKRTSSNTKEDQVPSKDLQFTDYIEFNGADFIDKIDYVKLEMTEESSFGEISKIRITKDHIYLLDLFVTYQLFVFDRSGRFVRKIGKKGKGPGEYLRLCDFDITDKEEIILYARQHKKMLFFKPDGTFIKESHTPFRADGIKMLPDDKILFSTALDGNQHRVFLTDAEYNIEKSFLPYPANYADDKLNTGLFTEMPEDRILYSKAVSDSLFVFNSSGALIKNYKLNFGKYTVPWELKCNYEKLVSERSNEIYRYVFNTPWMVGNYLVGLMFLPPNKAFFMYDLNRDKLLLSALTKETFSHKNINLPLMVTDNNIIVSYLDQELLDIDLDQDLIPQGVKTHVENSGVVLCFHHLKQQ